jgi:hypothetical protein
LNADKTINLEKESFQKKGFISRLLKKLYHAFELYVIGGPDLSGMLSWLLQKKQKSAASE